VSGAAAEGLAGGVSRGEGSKCGILIRPALKAQTTVTADAIANQRAPVIL
jgi:hypothetical protein